MLSLFCDLLLLSLCVVVFHGLRRICHSHFCSFVEKCSQLPTMPPPVFVNVKSSFPVPNACRVSYMPLCRMLLLWSCESQNRCLIVRFVSLFRSPSLKNVGYSNLCFYTYFHFAQTASTICSQSFFISQRIFHDFFVKILVVRHTRCVGT